MIVVVDFLVAITLVQQDIIAHLTINQRKQPPSIQTIGAYAITIDWGTKTDDVDLWVRDPAYDVVNYITPQQGLMNLEHDDTGSIISETQLWRGTRITSIGTNHERVIIRNTIPGEYIVNINMFRKDSDGPVPVTVALWDIRNNFTQVFKRVITLTFQGQEVTAFRFTVNYQKNITNINENPLSLIQGLR